MAALKHKQKTIKTQRQEHGNYDSIYEKNPRFKLQKLMKSRISQLNENCLIMNSLIHTYKDQSAITIGQKQIIQHRKYSNRSRYFIGDQKQQIKAKHRQLLKRHQNVKYASQSARKGKDKSHATWNNLQTIDAMKQKISKTLVKDLLSLQNIQQSLLSPKNNKHTIKIKLVPNRRKNITINYNQCCNLAEEKEKQLIINIKNQIDMTPKLAIQESRTKNVVPLIYFLKKKQYIERETDESSDVETSFNKKQRNVYRQGSMNKNCVSERKNIDRIDQLRKQQFSPWEMNEKNETNPEFHQAFFQSKSQRK